LTLPGPPPRPGAHPAPPAAVRFDGVSLPRPGATSRREEATISFAVAAGEFVAVTGLAGAGKTALLRLVAGLERPARGEVTVGGTRLTGLGSGALARFRLERVGAALPDMPLVEALELRENVALPLLLRRAPRAAALARAEERLRQFGLRAGAEALLPEEADPEDRQVARLARAAVTGAELLLLDEPTSALGQAAADVALRRLRRLVDEEGRTVVIATSTAAVAAHADREVRLRAGVLEPA